MIVFANLRLLRAALVLLVGVASLLTMTVAWAAPDQNSNQQHEFTVAAYDRVYISGDAQIELSQVTGEESAHVITLIIPDTIRLSATELDGLQIESSDNVLYLDTRGIPQAEKLTLKVDVENLKELVSHGAGHVVAQDLTLASLVLEGSGDGVFELAGVQFGELIAVGSGRTRFQLSGSVEHQFVELAGLGHYDARQLHSRYSQVSLHGSGHVDVWADELLDIDIDGIGDVQYNGSPWVLQQIAGLGEVRKLPHSGVYRL